MTAISISAEEFDRRFEAGEDMDAFLDMEHPVVHRAAATRKITFNFPEWLVEELDAEADHLAIPRQAVVIMWLAEQARERRAIRQQEEALQ